MYDQICVINQFVYKNQVIIMGMSFGGWAAVNFWFTLNNLSMNGAIDTKLDVWVAYIKAQLGTAQISVVKGKVTVTKNRKMVSSQ